LVCGIRFFRPFGALRHRRVPAAYAVGFILFAATRLAPRTGAVALTPGPSRPKRAIQRPVLNGFGDVFGRYRWGAFEVGYGSGYL